MGSIFAVPLVSLATQAAVALIRNWPGETVGASMKAVTDFRRTYRGPTLLVVGSESTGLSPEIAAACQTCVRIPMSGGTESLNAAVATALLLYEILRSAL
jgi:TrmH family RNA methyltransferase